MKKHLMMLLCVVSLSAGNIFAAAEETAPLVNATDDAAVASDTTGGGSGAGAGGVTPTDVPTAAVQAQVGGDDQSATPVQQQNTENDAESGFFERNWDSFTGWGKGRYGNVMDKSAYVARQGEGAEGNTYLSRANAFRRGGVAQGFADAGRLANFGYRAHNILRDKNVLASLIANKIYGRNSRIDSMIDFMRNHRSARIVAELLAGGGTDTLLAMLTGRGGKDRTGGVFHDTLPVQAYRAAMDWYNSRKSASSSQAPARN